MAQVTGILKGQERCIVAPLIGLVLLTVTGCASFKRDGAPETLPPAPQTVVAPQASVERQAVASAPAPVRDTYAPPAYASASSQDLLAAQEEGLVVTETPPSEFTRSYLAGDYAKPAVEARPVSPTSTTFSGQTYSVLDTPAATSASSSTGYVTADGKPYPAEYLDETLSPTRQRFATASDEYATYSDSEAGSYSGDTYSVTSETYTDYEDAGASDASNGGAYSLHLASYRVEANARKGWQVLAQRHGNVLGGLQPRVSRADIPGRGRFLRLKAGPFYSRGEAMSACEQIKLSGDYCDVMLFDGVSL